NTDPPPYAKCGIRLKLCDVPIDDANRTHVSGGRHICVGTQGLGDWAVAVDRGPRLFAAFVFGASTLSIVFVDIQGRLALARVHGDGGTIFDRRYDCVLSRLSGV